MIFSLFSQVFAQWNLWWSNMGRKAVKILQIDVEDYK
jgi:hypothetical protein